MSIHKKIPHIEELHQAAFMGFFAPVGVSAIFYLYVSLDLLNAVTDQGRIRPDAEHLKDVMHVVAWFLAICSIVVHGLSVPVGKLGYHIPRHFSRALSTS
jgi:sodium/hydrogen antiporter